MRIACGTSRGFGGERFAVAEDGLGEGTVPGEIGWLRGLVPVARPVAGAVRLRGTGPDGFLSGCGGQASTGSRICWVAAL